MIFHFIFYFIFSDTIKENIEIITSFVYRGRPYLVGNPSAVVVLFIIKTCVKFFDQFKMNGRVISIAIAQHFLRIKTRQRI